MRHYRFSSTDAFSKNNSSVIINFLISSDGVGDACNFLTGGDSEVLVWEKLWEKYGDHPWLKYDLMQAPHHCSWHTLSHESWSDTRGKAEVSVFAVNALSQAKSGATVVTSCKPIEDNNDDPPCIGAKREYQRIGEFVCTGEYSRENDSQPLSFDLHRDGPCIVSGPIQKPQQKRTIIGHQPLAHG